MKRKMIYFGSAVFVALTSLGLFSFFHRSEEVFWMEDALTREPMKSIYITMYSAGSAKRREELMKIVDETEINSVVVDVKDYAGTIAYDSAVAKAWGIETVTPAPQLAEFVSDLKKKGVYTIARMTLFQDPEFVKAYPDLAVKDISGLAWKDYKGLSWIDPTQTQAWDYFTDLSHEVVSLGFDEINYDYVRFPSDGVRERMVFANLPDPQDRRVVLKEFITKLSQSLRTESVKLSVDLFGFVTTKTDDLQVGQVLEDFAYAVDYICPMVYPSHYPSGYMDLKNPAAHPQLIVDMAMREGVKRLSVLSSPRAKLRPWLQDFDLGAFYTAAMVRIQIDTAEQYDVAGWQLWNARNVYTVEALKSVDK